MRTLTNKNKSAMRYLLQKTLMWIKYLLSPSFMVAHLIKNMMAKRQGRLGKFKAIFFLNRCWLIISIVIFVGLSIWPKEIDNTFSTSWQFFIGYLLLFSRVNEIFFAFVSDAFDKLSHRNRYSYFKMRLNLAFSSYIELIITFGSLYYVLASNGLHTDAIQGIKNAIDALYFSGVTITTLGYGDFLPNQWYTKLLSVYEVLCGFSLLLVSFTIYTSRAMK
ncbi:MAG: voltage-gated potassium channel [Alteromonadaceae bacterium]|jgi:voltage-gated potassium channel